MTPDLSRQIGRLFTLSAAMPFERDSIVSVAGPSSVKSLGDLPPSAQRLAFELQQRAESRARSLKHLLGQHNQDSHGNGVSVLGAIPGIPVHDADKYADLYGSVIDDAGIDLGNDAEELPLVARYFESGDMHVALHLEDGKVQVLEEMDPESMRQLAYDLEAVAGVDETEFEGGDVYDIIADAESESHGWYVAKDGVGDVRLRPPDAADEDYLEFSTESATEFFNALLDMADSYEDHFSGDEKSHRRARVKRNYVRDDDGQFAEVPGSGALDKLKLASRIQLGPGEKLLSSRKFKSSDDSSWDLLAAEVDTPAGREIRLGVINPADAKRWTAGPDPKTQARIAAIDAEMDGLDDSSDRYDELSEERSNLASEADDNDLNRTATLSPDGIAQLRAEIEVGERLGREHQKTFMAWWESPDGERLLELGEMRRQAGFSKPWSQRNEDDRRRLAEFDAEHGEELERLIALSPEPDVTLREGLIESPSGLDLVYSVQGADDGEGGWFVKLGVRPADDDEDWYPGVYDDAANFEPRDVKGLLANLAELASGTAKAATRHPHTTRSRDMLTLRAPLKNAQPGMAFKSFDAAIKAVDDTGTATIVIATLNEIDKDGDVTLPGFFGKQHTQMVPVHDWNHVPIGKGVVYESGNQVLADVKFNLDIAAAKDWHSAIAFDFKNPPALQQYSYGYTVKEGGSERGSFKGQSVRFLKGLPDGTPGVDVHEVSPVLVGAGNGTRTAAVKAHLRPARPARFTDEADAVLTAVKALSARAADVMAMRQTRGKRLGSDSAGLLAQIEAELKALQSVLTEPAASEADDELQRIYLQRLAAQYR